MKKSVKETNKETVEGNKKYLDEIKGKEANEKKIHIRKNNSLLNTMFATSDDFNNKELKIRDFYIFDKDSNSIISSFMNFFDYTGNVICTNLTFENPKGLVIQRKLDFTKNKIFFMKNKEFSYESTCYDCYISTELMNFKFYKSSYELDAYGTNCFYTNTYEMTGNFENKNYIKIYTSQYYLAKSKSCKLKEKYDKILEDIKNCYIKFNEDFSDSNFVRLNEELIKTFTEYKNIIEKEQTNKWDTSIEYIPEDEDDEKISFF